MTLLAVLPCIDNILNLVLNLVRKYGTIQLDRPQARTPPPIAGPRLPPAPPNMTRTDQPQRTGRSRPRQPRTAELQKAGAPTAPQPPVAGFPLPRLPPLASCINPE
jgi:hypothetical protein